MRTLLLFLFSVSLFSLFAQPQMEVEHNASTSAISVSNSGSGYAGSFFNYGTGIGLYVGSQNGTAIRADGNDSYAIWAFSTGSIPAGFFYGEGSASDITLGTGQGVLSSNLSNMSSDLLLKSNDRVIVHLDEDGDENGQFRIVNSSNSVLFQVEENGGVNVAERIVALKGIFSRGNNDLPDVEFGGTSSTLDNGVLSSSRSYSSSDLVFLSNDDVAIHLDDDNNEGDGQLRVVNGQNTVIFRLFENGNLNIAGSLNQGSDRNRKKNISLADSNNVLNQLLAMPIYEWQYKEESRRHIGPMAQDFHSAFKLGDDDSSISSIDADGVALAAIKALHMIIERQSKEIELFKKEMSSMKNQIDFLKYRD